MSLVCHCYSCNVDYPEIIYPSSDMQNLILQICKGIFEAIQNKNTSAEIICSILHEQIHNINEIENCINEEFNHQKRNEWLSDKDTNINKDELKQNLLDNLEDYLPGFKYLFEYSWDSYDDDNNLHKGDFIFASDSGVFIVVEVDITHEDAVKTKALKCKSKASEKYVGKYITLIGATFTNSTIELIDINDEIIIQNLKKFHKFSQSFNNNQITYPEINHNQLTHPSQQEESPSISVAGAVVGITAAAAIGYVICSRIPIKTVVTTERSSVILLYFYPSHYDHMVMNSNSQQNSYNTKT
ncbi:14816_t:CDS:2 [Rhizophagus irregularis]|nr:14816_t:CDS:2 [Rhizophagus irregularis]